MKLLEDYRDVAMNLLTGLEPATKKWLVDDERANFADPKFNKALLFPIVGSVEHKWQKAYDNAVQKDKDALAQAFLVDQQGTYGYDISDIDDIILHIIKDLGLKQSDNPFFKLLSGLNRLGVKLTRQELINLNNLYADGSLVYDDIGSAKSFLYNPQLWKNIDLKDRIKLIQYYGYVKSHKGDYSEQPIDKGEYATPDLYIRNGIKKYPDNPEKAIFVQSGPVATGTMRPVDQIFRFIERHYINDKSQTQQETKSEEQKKPEEKVLELSETKKKAIDRAVQDGNLRASDIKSIMAYLQKLYKQGRIR